jgi:ABC-2 type transport system permease protein
LLSGRFDLSFVLIYLYPLLILALSFNLISSEREQGTLAMALSQPVSLRKLVLGKTGLRAALVLLLSIAFLLMAIALGALPLSGEGAGARLGLWVVVLVAYTAFWFGLAIAVNALGRSSATNALSLATFWLALVVILPALVNLAATTLYPVPSRVEFINAMRTASNAASAEGSRLLAKYYEDHPELAPPEPNPDLNDFALRSIAVQEATERQIQPVLSRFDEPLARQQALVDRYSYLSPAILMQAALNDIAGTGAARYRHFKQQVEQYHQTWQQFFFPKAFQKVVLTASDYERMPRFQFQEEPGAAVAFRVRPVLIGLVVASLAVCWLGMILVRRYPIAG